MKKVTTLMAVVGVFIVAGAIGNDDVYIFSGSTYPLIETVKVCLLGLLLTVPAVVRGVYGKKFT